MSVCQHHYCMQHPSLLCTALAAQVRCPSLTHFFLLLFSFLFCNFGLCFFLSLFLVPSLLLLSFHITDFIFQVITKQGTFLLYFAMRIILVLEFFWLFLSSPTLQQLLSAIDAVLKKEKKKKPKSLRFHAFLDAAGDRRLTSRQVGNTTFMWQSGFQKPQSPGIVVTASEKDLSTSRKVLVTTLCNLYYRRGVELVFSQIQIY